MCSSETNITPNQWFVHPEKSQGVYQVLTSLWNLWLTSINLHYEFSYCLKKLALPYANPYPDFSVPLYQVSGWNSACALNPNTDCLVLVNFTMTTLPWRQFSDRLSYVLCMNVSVSSAGQVKECGNGNT